MSAAQETTGSSRLLKWLLRLLMAFCCVHALLAEDPAFSRGDSVRIYPQFIDPSTGQILASLGVTRPRALTLKLGSTHRQYTLHLFKDRSFIADGVKIRYQHENSTRLLSASHMDREDDCYYNGQVAGSVRSVVALSLCPQLSGVVHVDNDSLLLTSGGENQHYLTRHYRSHLSGACGTRHDASAHADNQRRVRRSVDGDVGVAFKSNQHSRYIELVLVMDHDVFVGMGANLPAAYRHTKQIANIVNQLFSELNVFVALVGVDVWSVRNAHNISMNSTTTLHDFLFYRKHRLTDMPNDSAQLLTTVEFDESVVGKAFYGGMCTLANSGGVIVDHSRVVGVVAATVAHEIGHTLNMQHDDEAECQCSDQQCIMSAATTGVMPHHWSQCSKDQMTLFFEEGGGYCLRNKPSSLFEGPVCGNGFVEAGEQCDCGPAVSCNTRCCHAASCQLTVNATCASGACCDLETCSWREEGRQCREAEGECGLDEFCTGHSALCPADVHKMNGVSCDGGQARCYDGVCASRESQCRMLWGSGGQEAAAVCYQLNTRGSAHGNCLRHPLNDSYEPCQLSDVKCGRLQCIRRGEKLQFGAKARVGVYSVTIENYLHCVAAVIDMGLSDRDPGLVPNGAICGLDKMCVDSRCVSVSSVAVSGGCTAESGQCGGHGVCNSRGHCHCDVGWAPPDCTSSGNGGSIDSGPPHSSRYSTFVVLMLVVFTGVMPMLCVAASCVLARRYHVKLDPRVSEVVCRCGKMLLPLARAIRCAGNVPTRRHSSHSTSSHVHSAQPRAPAVSSNGSVHPAAPINTTTRQGQVAGELAGNYAGVTLKPVPPKKPPPPASQRVQNVSCAGKTVDTLDKKKTVDTLDKKKTVAAATGRTTFAFSAARPCVSATETSDEKMQRPGPTTDVRYDAQTARTTFNMPRRVITEPCQVVRPSQPSQPDTCHLQRVDNRRSFKAAKIERARLRQLQISSPIQQQQQAAQSDNMVSVQQPMSTRSATHRYDLPPDA